MGKNQSGILHPYNWLKDSTRDWAILLGSIFLFVTHGSTLLTLGLLPTWARFNLTQLIFGDGSSLLFPDGQKGFGSNTKEAAPPLNGHKAVWRRL